MVYIDPGEMKWNPYVLTWIARFKDKLQEETYTYILDLFNNYVDDGLKFVVKKCIQAIHQVSFDHYILESITWDSCRVLIS